VQTLESGNTKGKVRHVGLQTFRRKLRQDTYDLDEIYMEHREMTSTHRASEVSTEFVQTDTQPKTLLAK
jgi:hypothetical protein